MSKMTPSARHLLLPICLLLWAGVSLGGNIIAAPAKFQVEVLTLPELLLVGRAQFAWLGITELILMIGVLGSWITFGPRLGWAGRTAIALLIVQQAALQPMLQERTDLILSGQPAASSHLHLVFIATEVVKCILLIVSALKILQGLYRAASGITPSDMAPS